MNGNYFMAELQRQVQAVQAMGNTCGNWGTTYKMYNEADSRLLDFIKRNQSNILLCLDKVFTDMWISTEDRLKAFISLYESADYDEALSMLGYATLWKYRRELENIEFTLL